MEPDWGNELEREEERKEGRNQGKEKDRSRHWAKIKSGGKKKCGRWVETEGKGKGSKERGQEMQWKRNKKRTARWGRGIERKKEERAREGKGKLEEGQREKRAIPLGRREACVVCGTLTIRFLAWVLSVTLQIPRLAAVRPVLPYVAPPTITPQGHPRPCHARHHPVEEWPGVEGAWGASTTTNHWPLPRPALFLPAGHRRRQHSPVEKKRESFISFLLIFVLVLW